MFRKLRPFLSAGIAAVLAAEAAVQPVFSAGEQTIETVSFSNVSTSLTIGTAPDFTAYLDGDTLLHASILNEGWSCISDSSAYAVKSEGLPIPDEPTGVPYRYALALTADSGWYFPEYITLYYEGNLIDSKQYTASVRNEGKNLILYCDFIPHVTPLAPDAQALSAAYILDAVLDYSAGESPRFTARPADPSQFEIVYERWADVQNPECFVTSSEQFNAEMGLTDENRLTVFEAGRQYHYDICIAAKYGYSFSDDAGVYVNGTPCTVFGHPADNIPVNDVCVITVKEAQTTMPVVTTAKSVTTTAKPVTTTAKPVTTTAKPVTTTAKPVTTTAKPVTTTVKTTSRPATSAEPDPDLLYGDVNQDGRVSIADAALLARCLAEDNRLLLKNAGVEAGDLNLDGLLTIYDLQLLLKIIMDADTENDRPAQNAVSDSDVPELSDLPEPDWMMPDNGGNSAAFTVKPFPNLTVSAEENALSYDGQLQFSPLSEDEAKSMNEMTAEYGWMVDCWHVDAGLKPEEYLPGTYMCSYDLSQLNIPEELYDRVIVQRIADDGTVRDYMTERNGDVLQWNSDQNSIVVIVIAGIPLAIAGATIGALAFEEIYTYYESKGDCILKYETPFCKIYFEDEELIRYKKKRADRMKALENEAEKQARQYAVGVVQDGWSAFAGLFVNYESEVNRLTLKRMQELLSANAEYQELRAIEEGYPADVLLLARQFELAESYLSKKEGCPPLSYKPDILFTSKATLDGEAVTARVIKDYMVIKRELARHGEAAQLVNPTKKYYFDLYETYVSKDIADPLLPTLAHEMYHLLQKKKIDMNAKNNIKFFEMSAMVVEQRAARHFIKEEYIASYTQKDVVGAYTTFGSAMDDCDVSNVNALNPAGYMMSEFWNYVSKVMNKEYNGWEILCGYAEYGTIASTMNNMFGFESLRKGFDDPYLYLNELWAVYHNSVSQAALKNAKDSFGTDKDSTPNYPSLMRRVDMDSSHPYMFFLSRVKNFACTAIGIRNKQAKESDNWSVILVRSKQFGEMQPKHQFLLPNNEAGQPIGAESKNGLVLTAKGSTLFFRERQDYGAVGTSNYRGYFIPAPETPDVTYDEKNEILTVNLKSPQSEQGAKGLTDKLMLVCTVNGKESYTKLIEPAEWSEPITIHAASLKLLNNQKNIIKITACEYIETGNAFKACRTAESQPFETDLSAGISEKTFSCSGCYGNVLVNSTAHFSLGTDKTFKFVFDSNRFETKSVPKTEYQAPEESGIDPFDDDTDVILNPLSKKGDYSGFTITGKIADTDDLYNWTAPILSCSSSRFHAYYYVKGPFYDALLDKVVDEEELEWNGNGMQSGTVQLSTSGSGTMEISVVIVTAEGNVKLSGSIK